MSRSPTPPATYQQFTARFPQLARAWELAGEAGQSGPLEPKTVRLLKLALAIGSMREGAVHSAVRQALAAGATHDEVDQIVALAASTIGFPAAAAVFTWTRDPSATGANSKRKKPS